MGLFDEDVINPPPKRRGRPPKNRNAVPSFKDPGAAPSPPPKLRPAYRSHKDAVAEHKRRSETMAAAQAARLEKARELEDLRAETALMDRQVAAMEAKDSLLRYTQFTMPDPEDPNDVNKSAYEAAEFHKLVAAELEAVERGDYTNLIFCMPPRHGKTELATKRLAAWYSGRHPRHNVAVGSYSDTMSEEFGSDVRSILASPQHKQVFPGYQLRRGGTAKGNMQTVEGGRLIFVGRGGAMTGRGAHLLLLDDVFKDHDEARSQAIRDEAWNWFTKVAMTRRMGKKLVIITMTRWHSDDVIGRLTDPNNPHYRESTARRWKIIRLPALAEEDDPLGREQGEPLWVEKYDADYLQEFMDLDEFGFATLFQQRPSVASGTLFQKDHFQYYTPEQLPKDLRYYCASDHAVGTKQRNDLTCMLKVGVDIYQNIYLIDCFWGKYRTDVVVKAMLDMSTGLTAPMIWWAEKGHISMSIGPFLHKAMLENSVYINMREMTPAADKEQRAQSIAARNATGKVYFPSGKIWTARAVDQCLAFPNGLNDDFVDAFAWIGIGLQSQFGASKPKNSVKPPSFGSLAWVKYNDAWQRERSAADRHGRFT